MDAKNVVAHSADISLNKSADPKGEFCKLWPPAKTGLELLLNIVKNPALKAIINIIIAAGDAVSKQVCG
jgi:hypothetical protein